MKKIFFAVLVAAMTVLSTPAGAGKVIELWYDTGGSPAHYGDIARKWKKNGDYVVIRDIQASSAALAILYAWYDLKVPMCYGKSKINARPMLWLHQTKSHDKKGNWVFFDESAKWGYPSPTGLNPFYKWKKVHPKELGIPACSPGLKADVKIVPRP